MIYKRIKQFLKKNEIWFTIFYKKMRDNHGNRWKYPQLGIGIINPFYEITLFRLHWSNIGIRLIVINLEIDFNWENKYIMIDDNVYCIREYLKICQCNEGRDYCINDPRMCEEYEMSI